MLSRLNFNPIRRTLIASSISATLKNKGLPLLPLLFISSYYSCASFTYADEATDKTSNSTKQTADNTDNATKDAETIVVTATMNNSTVTEESHSYTIKNMATASKLNLTPRETPQSVSVITKQQMNDQNMVNLQDAMVQTTGVNVIYEGSHQVRFQSRGFTMDNYKEDGVSSSAQNSVSGMGSAEASSEAADLAIYDHVEVLRGASGLTQGSGEPGGTINLVRKKPTYEYQGYAKVGAGSWDDYRSEIDMSGALFGSEHVRGRFVAAYQDKDSFVDYINNKRSLLYGIVAFDFSPATTLSLGLNWQKTKTVPDWYGLPMSTNYKSLDLSRHTFLGASWNNLTFEKKNIFAEFEHLFDNEWALKTAINYTRSTADGDSIGLYGNGTSGVGSNGNAKLNNYLYRDNSGKQLGLDINLSRQFEFLERTHDFVIGADYSKENFDNIFKSITENSVGNVHTWDPSSVAKPDWSNPTRHSNYLYNIYQKALYTTGRFTIVDDLKFIAGTRYSAFSQDFYSRNKITQAKSHSGYKENDKFIPYAGLVWDFLPDYSWYASYSEIYKPQNVQNSNNQLLDPITGTNYETGVKGDFLDGNLNVSLAFFRIIQKNRPLTDPNCSGGNSCYKADGEVQSQGYELEAAGNLTERWKLFAGYTFNKSKYLKAENTTTRKKGSNYSMYTPEHLFKLYTSYEMPGMLEGLTVGAGFTTQSDTDTIYDIKQGGYTLLNANANYQYNKNLSFNLALHNITDKIYYLSANNRHRGANNFYGTPRNFSLTTTYNF